MRTPLLAALAIACAACSSARTRDAGESGPAPVAAVSPPAAAPVASGWVDAAALARETGLSYEDSGASVLLASAQLRARFYPGSDRLTLDGASTPMGVAARREGPALVVPQAGADAVRRALVDARARCAQPVAGFSPKPLMTMPAPQPVLAPVEVPAPTPVRSAGGEPSWTSFCAAERPWRWIVIHHSDDHSGCLAKYEQVHLEKGWENGCGYHFVVGNGSQTGDGEIETSGRWFRQQQGAHTKTDDNRFNEYGVGICLVGDFENSGQPSARQYEATVRLTRWLMARYGVGADRVLRHSDCKATACPGRLFPWGRFKKDLSGGSSL